MKPFYTKQMLVEMNTEEVQTLRTAVANEMERWSDKDEDGKLIFELRFKTYEKAYKDLSNILAQMPWDM